MGRTGMWQVGLVSLGILALAAGCQPNTNSSAGGGGSGASSTGGSTSSGGTTSQGGSTGGNTGGSTGGSTGGTGGQNNDACEMDVTDATVYQVTDGTIGEKVKVRLDGVIAMSNKFLVSHSKSSGSCLWGVFVSAATEADGATALGTTAAGSGVVVLSYGPNADSASMQPCLNHDAAVAAGQEADADVIPDDVKAGDVLKVVGTTSRFLQAACGTNPNDTDLGQLQIFTPCKAEKTGATKPVPSPHVLTVDELGKLAVQKSTGDGDIHNLWAGVKVRTPAVTPKQFSGNTCGSTMDKQCCAAGVPACTVDPYGNIILNEGGVSMPDSLYYLKTGETGAGDLCHVGPKFTDSPAPQWDYVQGFVQLNFCTWGLDATDKCADFSPSPNDCQAASVPACF
ncbi:MAG: hypothetical protein U0441_28245 [Polyangiaceae bacterium]